MWNWASEMTARKSVRLKNEINLCVRNNNHFPDNYHYMDLHNRKL